MFCWFESLLKKKSLKNLLLKESVVTKIYDDFRVHLHNWWPAKPNQTQPKIYVLWPAKCFILQPSSLFQVGSNNMRFAKPLRELQDILVSCIQTGGPQVGLALGVGSIRSRKLGSKSQLFSAFYIFVMRLPFQAFLQRWSRKFIMQQYVYPTP